MPAKNFIYRGTNQGFICAQCGQKVPPHPHGTRNHCPFCLASRHVDQTIPGDRSADCGATMPAIALDQDGKRGWILVQRCLGCGTIRRNKAAPDDDIEALSALVAGLDQGPLG